MWPKFWVISKLFYMLEDRQLTNVDSRRRISGVHGGGEGRGGEGGGGRVGGHRSNFKAVVTPQNPLKPCAKTVGRSNPYLNENRDILVVVTKVYIGCSSVMQPLFVL